MANYIIVDDNNINKFFPYQGNKTKLKIGDKLKFVVTGVPYVTRISGNATTFSIVNGEPINAENDRWSIDDKISKKVLGMTAYKSLIREHKMKKTIKLSDVRKLIRQELHEAVQGIKKNLTAPEKHQLKIAKDTLKMSDAGAIVMGGMTKEEAREFLRKIGYSDTRIKKLEEGNRNMRKRSLREGNSSTMWTAFKKLQDRLHSSEFSLRALLSQGKIDDNTFNKLMKKLSSAIEDIEKTAKV